MKKITLFLSLLLVATLACDMSVTVVPPTNPVSLPTNTLAPVSPTSILPTIAPAATSDTTHPAFDGVEIAVDPLRIVLVPGLANGARGIQVPHAEGQDVAPWDVTPGHIQLKLEGYLLQDKSQQPQFYVYPAQAYAEMHPAAFEGIRRLNGILHNNGASIQIDQLPGVPFFNATQIFASNIQVVSFQNGRGVRFLTQYAQYAASANNHDLFYQFQGLTDDGNYYLIAILPVSAPVLAESSDAGAPLPLGGVPYPYYADPEADMENYYASVMDVLNATSPQAFTPTIYQLDSLIQSIRIAQ
jgi:hypothetical protein